MQYTIENVAKIIGGSLHLSDRGTFIHHISYDSRQVVSSGGSLFFCIVTAANDGHKYIESAYSSGIRNFVVSSNVNTNLIVNSNIIHVKNTIDALQQLAAHHRTRFHVPVVGITGSNGKTIVKEWLYQLLQSDYQVVRSPKSFNSQIGVPLSVLQLAEHHTLGLFEAGVSKAGEMSKLEAVIKPTIGILTNIGEAHDAGFTSRQEKLNEKLSLFQSAEIIIFCKDEVDEYQIANSISRHTKLLRWSFNPGAEILIKKDIATDTKTTLSAKFLDKDFHLKLYFTDEASIENVIHCWCLLMHLGFGNDAIQKKFTAVHKIEMRMQLLHAINHCVLINDSYSADLTSLQIALQFLHQQSAGLKKTVIISDFFETGKNENQLYAKILLMFDSVHIEKVIAIGGKISSYINLHSKSAGNLKCITYPDTEAFISNFRSSDFSNEIILLKGSRIYRFEQIAALLEVKKHQTILKIDLNALSDNLKEYKKLLQPTVRIMAMVKAFSYGSGVAEIAGILQFDQVDFLGVAYTDEGVQLVRAGITIPVMVMNAEESSFATIVQYRLQPVMYSFQLLKDFVSFIESEAVSNYPVHIEIDTGMNRLGFSPDEVEQAGELIRQNQTVKVVSVFSHLTASEDQQHDAFTTTQLELFNTAAAELESALGYSFIKHIANSAAVIRHPSTHLDMVRLGIGLYGIEAANAPAMQLKPVATLVSTIAQLRSVNKGESVSYSRRGVVKRDSVIATVRIGYADGYSRQFSNGKGYMLVRGKLAPVTGMVCMDMTMLDVTEIENVTEGDEVIIFGNDIPVNSLADWANTIPYEILTSVSQRVKRIYYKE